MHSSAAGTAARIVSRSFSSARRWSGVTAARYSSIVVGLAATVFHLLQNFVQPLVTRRDALLHARGDSRVAGLLGREVHLDRNRGLVAVFSEEKRCHLLTALGFAAEVERFGTDDPLGPDDFAVDAVHRHVLPLGP